ncbi:hypothetical protein MPSEU_001019900 [Mayamaea pseudoterrestris]|nr:hypothetical protein MPSEU_001019900 [Mayamaea pseudoterrestris]
MKLALTSALLAASVSAFQPIQQVSQASCHRSSTHLSMGSQGMDLSGNAWKPDSAKMGSTDTGDYFPEGYDANSEIAFTEGMGGSQALLNGGNRGVEMPGLDFGDSGYMVGGIEQASEIPAGMQFIPSSVPDGELVMDVASSSTGKTVPLEVAPVCMTFEDYFAAFSPDSHPSFSVAPVTGRMDRRGGEKTVLSVTCNPNGQAGEFAGNLVINLPEDNSKICYKIIAKCY